MDGNNYICFIFFNTAFYLCFLGGYFKMYFEDGFECFVVGDFVDEVPL